MIIGEALDGPEVVTLDRCRVRERVGSADRDRVVLRVDPGLAPVQDAVIPVVTARRPRHVSAEQWVGHGQVRERDGAGVRHGEGVLDLFTDRGRRGTGLREADGRVDRDRRGVPIGMNGSEALEAGGHGRAVLQRIGSPDGDRVVRRVDPDLVLVQDAVAGDVALRRARDVPAEEGVVDPHVREIDVPRVRDRERIPDLLADQDRRRPGLCDRDPGGDVQGQRMGVAVLNASAPELRGDGRVVDKRVLGVVRDRVVLRVDPGLGGVQDAVAGDVARSGARDVPVEQRVVNSHVREVDGARVRHGECESDLLTDPGRSRSRLREVDPRRHIQGHDVRVAVLDRGALEVGGDGRVVHQRVRIGLRDRVVLRVDPGLAPVQDAVVSVVARSGARDVPVEQRVVHRHIPERYVSGVRDREDEPDLFADPGRRRSRLREVDSRRDHQVRGVDRGVADQNGPVYGGHGRVVLQRVLGVVRDRVSLLIDPGLGIVQDAVVPVVAGRCL